ncbi:MAG: DNA polymerase III subunit gamma/tau [Betaproteobacteria bacterium]|nr:DNA polymerase III subunit gamma/tau [Betaproteobacteria bacterium]
MSSTVLARKWRPKTFATLVGQDHVVRALTHALQRRRLHHAYLFTGTRGVGKTTIARILAKSLNCTGPDGQGDITSEPCGVCPSCMEIDAGRFVDYIELDAASNRGVDDMTRLLEQAVYKPTAGRFKVYMIDEVHMLSNHAFNAMLKTLEEPPQQVMFVLATTDPQKVPVTVLSRCLQFALKSVPPAAVASHLQQVLRAEGVDFEAAALQALGRAARGSMRDALSLADQAIAFDAGRVSAEGVRQMLGAVDSGYLFDLLRALARGDAQALLELAETMDQRALSLPQALEDLAALLQRLAVLQVLPQSLDEHDPDAAALRELAAALSPESLQLTYSMVLQGRGELGLAPDPLCGFSMVLLRLLSFAPVATAPAARRLDAIEREAPRANPGEPAPRPLSGAQDGAVARQAGAAPVRRSAPDAAPAVQPEAEALADPEPEPAPEGPEPTAAQAAGGPGAQPRGAEIVPAGGETDGEIGGEIEDWPALARELPLVALARSLALQSEWVGAQDGAWVLRVPSEQYTRAGALERVQAALSERFGRAVVLRVEVGAVRDTAHLRAAALRAQRQQEAEQAIAADPLVRQLVDELGAQIVPGSVRPVDA